VFAMTRHTTVAIPVPNIKEDQGSLLVAIDRSPETNATRSTSPAVSVANPSI